ncbi:hypothetical protein ATE84_3616 [Aquimarina sp. MAR_2010_214]|uniref:hypothetical protein n=1 Tax=Aquimarina sp. MAR_2010_214 TaxID=1250026 RepID=UPI000C6FEFEC|nr:hypothetical protein [Aquimarina sp. MAR_2010_214]PKV51531.1 hypothetical protein ATE84_3616 [Aquimarina sp. MAR_2010_214]
MNKIYIENNLIKYDSKYDGMHSKSYWTMNKDQSWILDLDKVLAIGGINCMDGDDDSYFIVFIDSNLKKYFLNVTWEILGINKLHELFEKRFQIGLTEWCKDFYDREEFIFPKSIAKKKLYKKSIKKKLRKILMLDHVADGEFNDVIRSLRK